MKYITIILLSICLFAKSQIGGFDVGIPKVPVFDSVIIKTDPNHIITIGTQTGVLLHNESALWGDESIPTLSLAHGASIPEMEEMGTSGMYMLAFDGTSTEEKVFGIIKVPEIAKPNDSIYVYVHCKPSTADVGNYTWNLSYLLTLDDSVSFGQDTLSVTLSADGLLKSKTVFFKGIYIEIPKTRIVFCFFRKPTLESDTYEHDVFTGLIGFKYRLKEIGIPVIEE